MHEFGRAPEGIRIVAKRRFRKYFPVIALIALAVAAWLIWESVREYTLGDIVASVEAISLHRLSIAAFCAAASYAVLTLFDHFGVVYCDHRLPYRKAALASFVSLSLGHSIGLAPLGSGALRARYYDLWGFSAEAIAKIIVFTTVTVSLGQIGFAGIVLAAAPGPSAEYLHLAPWIIRLIGVACIAVLVAYIALACWMRAPLRIRSWSFKLPRWRLAALQVIAGTVNFAFLAVAMHQLLVVATNAPFWTVANAFVLANVAALISHVPGGLGVIEYVILSFFPDAQVFGPTLVYRTFYYLIPLGVGLVVFAATAVRWKRALRLVSQPA
jgi:glycosyltransferase 2 family protein